MRAGDLDLSLHLLEGEHRVTASAGDVDIELLKGSSVTVEGSVGMGDFDTEGFSAEVREGLTGGAFSGVVGGGKARLKVQMSAGDLDVTAA